LGGGELPQKKRAESQRGACDQGSLKTQDCPCYGHMALGKKKRAERRGKVQQRVISLSPETRLGNIFVTGMRKQKGLGPTKAKAEQRGHIAETKGRFADKVNKDGQELQAE